MWDTREDISPKKNALYKLQYAIRHLLGRSAIKIQKENQAIAIAIVELRCNGWSVGWLVSQ